MKRTLILLIAMAWFSGIKAQGKTDAMLFGDVKSITTNEHIPFATVAIKGSHLGTTADATGHFKLANLPVGKLTLVAQALGYKSQEIEVEMKRDEAVKVFFELQDDVLSLEQLVVTGTRTAHFVKDVPIRTEVITAKAIEDKNAGNLFQALEGVPGVRVENQCQFCNFTMVRMHGLGPEHTQVLINGQPLFSGLAGVYGLQQLSTIDVGRIEIVKGAGSALYGSRAVAGAINIITKEPSYSPQTTVDLQMGSYNTNKFDVFSSLRNEKGNVGLLVFAQRMTEGVIDETGPGLTRKEVMEKDGITDRVATNLTNAGFGLFIDNAFAKNDRLAIRGKSTFENRQGGDMTDDLYLNPFTEGTENIVTERYETEISYRRSFGQSTDFNVSLAWVNHNRNATNDTYLMDYTDIHGEAPDVQQMRPYLAKENSLVSTISLGRKIGNHHILMGVQGMYDRLQESGMYVVVDENNAFFGESYRSVAEKSAREAGFFIQDEWSVNSRLMVVPGIRFDSHKSGEEYKADQAAFENSTFPKTSFSQPSINPRLAVKYMLTPSLALRANAGSGFRAPYGFSEDLHLCSGSPRVWKSSELNPEKSISFNASLDYYSDHLRLSTNYFRTHLKDKIGFTEADEQVAALGYDYQWQNIDDAVVQGIEFTVIGSLTRDLIMGVDVTFSKGVYNNTRDDWAGTEYESMSKYISRYPVSSGYVKLEYSPKSWNFTLTGNYQGNMYIDYFNEDIDPVMGNQSKIKKTEPFMAFNSRVSKRLNSVRIYGGVNNILNYIQPERHLDDPAFIYAPLYGRMIYGGIAIDIRH